MVYYICRDYLQQNSTSNSRRWLAGYLMSIFLRRILGYTYVGDTNYPINNFGNLLIASGDTTPTAASPTFPGGSRAGIANNGANIEVQIPLTVKAVETGDIGRILVLKSTRYPTRNAGLFAITALQRGNTTTIAAGSNGAALPQGTINVASTSGFPASGTFFVGSNTTTSPISTTIASASNNVSLPTGTINVANTAGFATSGTILVVTSTGTQVVTYTGTTGSTFTGCTGGTGTMLTGNAVQQSSTITVASTTGFTTTGQIIVYTTTGSQTVTYTGITATTFTGCTGLTSLLYSGGSVFNGNGFQTITYTGTNATQFTGCTGGTGTLVTGQTVYNQNKYIIDYRGNGDLAIVEANDTVMWWLYDKDINCPINGAGNGLSGYNSVGSSVTPRIILQSPHALGWQVRICNESTADSSANIFNGSVPPVTAAPGFGGNSAGDFPIGGDALHAPNYFDKNGNPANFDYYSGNGFGDDNAGTAPAPQHRFYFFGDDTGQSVHMVARRLLNATGPRSIYVTFGLPDNEPIPLPIKDIRRLYVLASVRGDVGNGQVNDVGLYVGYSNSVSMHGTAFHEGPISCHPSQLCYVTNNNQLAGPTFDASAGDCPFTSATELMPVDITAGTIPNWTSSTSFLTMQFYPKTLGSIPIMRNGRANFGLYTLTTDNSSWTISTATNATPIQITTTAPNTLVTGQSVAIHSVTGNDAANGTFTVTVINSTNFTLNGSVGTGAGTGGTVLRGAQWQHMRNGIYFPWNGPAVAP